MSMNFLILPSHIAKYSRYCSYIKDLTEVYWTPLVILTIVKECRN